MRTTIRIEDELLVRLKEEAVRKRMPFSRLVNQILRTNFQANRSPTTRKRQYQEKTHPLGTPLVSLNKANALAAYLEDEENLRKMAMRK
ncbi:MAG: hypothetical protein NPIRA02_16600 [Nitrospirales bacterium]|nr:MAG: hypothetical protein NPIRA02_16600 [Nitrospirales bacterium]